MRKLNKECTILNQVCNQLLENKWRSEVLLDVFAYCTSGDDLYLMMHNVLDNGDNPDKIYCPIFINELNKSDHAKKTKHILKIKETLTQIVYKDLIYGRFVNWQKIDKRKLFAKSERTLRKMIKLITYDIIMYQICTDGVVYYEPKVISMCICIYITDSYIQSKRRGTFEKLFKKYNERQYLDVKLSDFADNFIFKNDCDPDLTSFANNALLNYNMDTYKCFGKHNIYVSEVLRIIKKYLEKTNCISLYQYLSEINDKIFIWWMIREAISLPKEMVSIIVYDIINLE